MNTYNFDVNFTTGRIYGPDLLLVVNDHNSTTFKFTFDQEGRYVFKLLYPDNTIYVQDIVDGELVLTKGILNQEGNYQFEISLYGDDNRLTTARIKEFPVRLELVETDEPVQADDRLPILDNLIEETNKVVEAAKNGDLDGATFTPSVSEDGDLSWSNDKGKDNPPTVNIKGAKGDPGAVKMQVVDTLPEVGDTDTIYLLKKDTPGQQNLYDEYVYTETSGWEHIGDTSVDLTDYYTKEETEEKLNSKQDALTAGNNITIEDNVISASGGNDFLVITTPTYLSFTSSGTSSKDLTDINKEDILNCLNSGSYDKPILLKTHLDSDGYQETYIFNVSTIQLRYNRFQYVLDKIYQTTNYPYNFVLLSLKPTGTYPNYTDVSATVNMSYRGNIMKTTDVLLRNNTSSYTPTSDYNPATKKYVDDGLGTKIGENQFVFAKTFNGNDNANYSRLFHQSGCTDSEVCGYFSDILTKMYTNAQGTYYNQISGILLLTLPNINNGFCGVFEYYSTTRKFYSVNTEYNRSIVYEIEWTGSIDDDKKEITVSKVKINSDYIKTDAPTANQHVANKQYVDDLPKSYTGYDATKTQVLKNLNGTLTWITEE